MRGAKLHKENLTFRSCCSFDIAFFLVNIWVEKMMQVGFLSLLPGLVKPLSDYVNH